MLTTEQVLEKLKVKGITENIQTVRRWIRNGELPAKVPVKRKDGYLISEADLVVFIEKKRKSPKRTAADYEAEIQQLRADLDRLQTENVYLREELQRANDREKFLSADLHNAIDKLDEQKKTSSVDWKRKYDEALKRGREKTNMLITAEQEIDILKKKLADPEKYGVQTKSAAVEDGPILLFTVRFQFQSKKYEAKVYTYRGKYSVYLYEVWGSYKKEVQIDKSTPLFKRFLKIVKEKHGVSIEMALASWQQLVSDKEADL
ncbi:helix-turn-helix domain-containing protein [Brevibacillus centrosporus]|uniref:helix-turn-helix domain-containing protein n=1 Tax=Brevibacillus centrosporus TaxID=54910 RepID=UPI003B0218E0